MELFIQIPKSIKLYLDGTLVTPSYGQSLSWKYLNPPPSDYVYEPITINL